VQLDKHWRVLHFLPRGEPVANIELVGDHQSILPIDGSSNTLDVQGLIRTPVTSMILGMVYLVEHMGIPLDTHRSLVVGLGGGSLCTLLLTTIRDSIRVDAVEIDSAVVDAARDYFFLPRSERLQITVADAGAFLPSVLPYDCIFLDMFRELSTAMPSSPEDNNAPNQEASSLTDRPWHRSQVPPVLLGSDFYQKCYDSLSPAGGVLIINFVMVDPPSSQAWLAAITAVFGKPNMSMIFPFRHQGIVLAIRPPKGSTARPPLGPREEFVRKIAHFEKHHCVTPLSLQSWI
jgi:hypothetical protein